MEIIICPRCGRRVSGTAYNCTFCSWPLRNTEAGKTANNNLSRRNGNTALPGGKTNYPGITNYSNTDNNRSIKVNYQNTGNRRIANSNYQNTGNRRLANSNYQNTGNKRITNSDYQNAGNRRITNSNYQNIGNSRAKNSNYSNSNNYPLNINNIPNISNFNNSTAYRQSYQKQAFNNPSGPSNNQGKYNGNPEQNSMNHGNYGEIFNSDITTSQSATEVLSEKTGFYQRPAQYSQNSGTAQYSQIPGTAQYIQNPEISQYENNPETNDINIEDSPQSEKKKFSINIPLLIGGLVLLSLILILAFVILKPKSAKKLDLTENSSFYYSNPGRRLYRVNFNTDAEGDYLLFGGSLDTSIVSEQNGTCEINIDEGSYPSDGDLSQDLEEKKVTISPGNPERYLAGGYKLSDFTKDNGEKYLELGETSVISQSDDMTEDNTDSENNTEKGSALILLQRDITSKSDKRYAITYHVEKDGETISTGLIGNSSAVVMYDKTVTIVQTIKTDSAEVNSVYSIVIDKFADLKFNSKVKASVKEESGESTDDGGTEKVLLVDNKNRGILLYSYRINPDSEDKVTKAVLVDNKKGIFPENGEYDEILNADASFEVEGFYEFDYITDFDMTRSLVEASAERMSFEEIYKNYSSNNLSISSDNNVLTYSSGGNGSEDNDSLSDYGNPQMINALLNLPETLYKEMADNYTDDSGVVRNYDDVEIFWTNKQNEGLYVTYTRK